VCRADLIIFMCRLSRNLGASTSWNAQGLPRPVTGIALPLLQKVEYSPPSRVDLKKRLSFNFYEANGNDSLVVIRAGIRVEGKHCKCNAKRTLSASKTSTVRPDATNPKYLRNTNNSAWRFRWSLTATTP
jgi:hypothetical protein